MKGLLLLALGSLFFITGACSNSNKEELKLNENVKQIIFFSNESDYTGEASYYDALIELKNSFPKEIKNMIVFSSSKGKKLLEEYNIESYPALLVIYNSKVLVKIDGNPSKEEIIKPITEALINE